LLDLIEEEGKRAWDYDAETNNLAEYQIEASNITHHLLAFERKYVSGNRATEQIPQPKMLDMGGQLLTNRGPKDGVNCS